ncbi:hypothetical protein GPJ56_004100 [Histomonas meleagridis]|uniref:uncharacterized protein n=1 Tax=Histomonas meleagridis TaxID=135588 RepID=UPI00355A86A5|nr:hypothetical protein GPJ56_004100 [Histomonas meleagridis]KAH0801441.1 hypothetical protein GO595_005693 [Histomonas meleagridis]
MNNQDKKPVQNKNPTPLPRFAPARPRTNSMTSSRSVPMLTQLNTPLPTKKEIKKQAPARKPRQPHLLDFANTPSSMRKQTIGEVLHPPNSKPVSLIASDDTIQDESNIAVQLPLVPVPEQKTPISNLLSTEKGDKLILVQLPSSLPIAYPNDSAQIDTNPLVAAADGQIGTIQIHQSGKVTAKFGNIQFDVSSGVAPSCIQLLCVKTQSGIEYAPISGNKLQFNIDVDQMLSDISKEAD